MYPREISAWVILSFIAVSVIVLSVLLVKHNNNNSPLLEDYRNKIQELEKIIQQQNQDKEDEENETYMAAHKHNIIISPHKLGQKNTHIIAENHTKLRGKMIPSSISSKTLIIPKIFFQSYASQLVPRNMACNINNNINLNQEWEYMFFDNIDAQLFMHKNFPGTTSDAFDILLPGAFKCDLWRLCALFHYGGIY